MESCWAAGKLTFEKQSLGEICRYMARWYGTEIHIDRAIAHDYAYTFTITDEPLEEILRHHEPHQSHRLYLLQRQLGIDFRTRIIPYGP